jgi:hypothetical protein
LPKEFLEECKKAAKRVHRTDSIEYKLKEFLENTIKQIKIQLTFDGDYLSGKLDAYQEILEKLKELC